MSDILVISTNHIKHDTVEFLNSQSVHKTVNAITVNDSSPQGWTIEIGKDAFDKTKCEDLPSDLGICIMFALEHDHNSFKLEPDGQIIAYMPRYTYAAFDDENQPGLEFCYCGPALLYTRVLNEYIQIHEDRH